MLEVVVDMCRFGLRAADGGLHRKSTRIVSSSQALVSELIGKRCAGDHQHSWVLGGSQVTSAASHYFQEFADAVVRGFMAQYDFEQTPVEAYVLENTEASEVQQNLLQLSLTMMVDWSQMALLMVANPIPMLPFHLQFDKLSINCMSTLVTEADFVWPELC